MLWPINVVNTIPAQRSEMKCAWIQKYSFGPNMLFGWNVWSLRGLRAKLSLSSPIWQRWKRPAFLFGKLASVLIVWSLCAPVEAKAEMAPEMVNRIVTAIYHAEGGTKAKKPYGVLSVPCNSAGECRRVCENTVRNNYRRWLATDRSKTYLEFLAGRYAPVSAHPLNKHWLSNVQRFIYAGAA